MIKYIIGDKVICIKEHNFGKLIWNENSIYYIRDYKKYDSSGEWILISSEEEVGWLTINKKHSFLLFSKYFMLYNEWLTEWRDKQINQILEDD